MPLIFGISTSRMTTAYGVVTIWCSASTPSRAPSTLDGLVRPEVFDEQPSDGVVVLDDQHVSVAHGSSPWSGRSIKSAR